MRYSAVIAIPALAPVLLALPVAGAAMDIERPVLLAQAGSAGGSIGKQGKSVSGGDAAPAPPRAKPAPQQRSSRPARGDTAAKPSAGPAGCRRSRPRGGR